MSDLAARERAAHGYNENLVVVAGAGTGKTSLLVERVLCQMVERELGSEELVAITFTEKAAAEMRRRLEAGLAQLAAHAAEDRPAAELDPSEEADRAFAWLRERTLRARSSGSRRSASRAAGDKSPRSTASAPGCCAASPSRPASIRLSRHGRAAGPSSSTSCGSASRRSRRSRRRAQRLLHRGARTPVAR
jgi:ATP-dependent exoDNAse (exonuclease V) beta subunit